MPPISDELLESIRQEEGFHTTGKDFAGIPTVGFGHKLTAEEIARGTVKVGGTFVSNQKLTEDQDIGLELLREDIERTQKKLIEQFGEDKLSGNRLDALTSLSFNVGDITAAAPKLSQALRENNDEEAAKQFLDINKVRNQKTLELEENPVLSQRRQREAAQFLTPDTSAAQPQQPATQSAPVPIDPAQLLQNLPQEPALLPELSVAVPEQPPVELAELDFNTLSDAQLGALAGEVDFETLSDEELAGIANLPEDAPQEPLEVSPDPTLSQAPAEPTQGILGQLPSAAAEQVGTQIAPPEGTVASLLSGGLSGQQVSEADLNILAARKGLTESVAGRGLQALGVPVDPRVAQFEPETGSAQQAITTLTSFIDPAIPVVFKGLGPLTRAASKIVGPSAKLQSKFSKVAQVAERAELLGVDRAKIDPIIAQVNTRMARATYRKIATNLGIGGGGLGFAEEAADQALKSQLDTKRLLGATATGAAAGAALGVGGTAILRGAGKLSNKVLRMLNRDKTLLSGGNVDPQKVANSFEAADKATKSLVKKGIVTAERAALWRQNQFLLELGKRNVNFLKLRGAKEPLSLKGGAFLNNVELANSIDKKFGTQLTGTFEKLIQGRFRLGDRRKQLQDTFGQATATLEQQGVDRNAITRLLQYVESTPQGPVFNPAAEQITSTYFRPAWLGPVPSPQVMEQLSIIRNTFDDVAANAPELGRRLGYIKGYVPLVRKAGTVSTAEAKAATTRGISEPGFTKSRTAAGFDENLFETDFTKLANFYSNSAAKHETLSPVIKDIGVELSKLQVLGRRKEAEKMAEQFASGLGLKNKLDVRRTFGKEVVERNSDFIEAMAKETQNPQGFADEFAKSLQTIMFDGTVFSSPTVMIKQLMQPELVGTAELGAVQMARARRLALNKSDRALALEHMGSMKSADPSNFAELPLTRETTNRTLREAERISGIFAGPGKVTFNRLDTENRIVGFLAGRDAFKRNGNAVLDNMLFGEKELVRKVLREEGEEAASIMAGIIQSRRINFAYTVGDKPSAWAQGIGQFIPFTTWGRNQFSRIVGDLQSGNPKQLAKRMAIPYAQLLAFKVLTGYQVPNAHPLQAVQSILTADALPVVAESVEQIASGRLPTAPVTRFASPVKMAKRAASIAQEDDKVRAITGLKKLNDNSVAAKLRKLIQRGL